MPSTTPYTLWIRGVNASVTADALSECATDTADDFPTAIAEPSVLNGWTGVGFYAAHPDQIDEGKSFVIPGGEMLDDPRPYRTWEINLEFHTFPDDESIREEILAHLRKRQLFIAFETYEAAAPQHTAGKVIAVNRIYKCDHDDQKGTKQLTLTLRTRNPRA